MGRQRIQAWMPRVLPLYILSTYTLKDKKFFKTDELGIVNFISAPAPIFAAATQPAARLRYANYDGTSQPNILKRRSMSTKIIRLTIAGLDVKINFFGDAAYGRFARSSPLFTQGGRIWRNMI
jgi:hypothetical protein